MTRLLLLSDINSVHTRKWVEGLLTEGFRIHLFSLTPPEDDYSPDPKNFSFNALFETNELVKKDTGFGKLRYFKGISLLRKIKREFDPHIVHAHYASSYGALALLAGLKPYSVSCWGSEVFDFPKRSFVHKTIFKRVISSAFQVYSTSERMKLEILNYVNRDIEVIPFGIDTEKFKSHRDKTVPSETLVIGTVKALEEIYGIDRLLEAYAIFLKQYAGTSELKIYGKGSKESEYKKMAEQLGIADKVIFGGFVSGNDLIEAYNNLDIYCALSRQESFGVAVLEASAMELPVIVSNVGGLPEVVKNGDTGFIISEGKPELTAQKLMELSNPEKRAIIGKAGRNFVLEDFNFEKNLKRQVEVYKQQLNKHD